ncbi:unnamed protein product [Bemisia tabaci]|uniref:AAA-ATPase-like domain-containing protein n=1 Tax=Bemisia tabaci TaxID=7038 RepID=A0A9P0CAG5_BEMTA|nr:unnamed protein product [Bemisia tabaci]
MRWSLLTLLLGWTNCLTGKTDDGNIAPTSFFGEIRSSKTFVDKTLWLKEFLGLPSKHVYLTAPLRFGKTTNLKMMEEFFSITNNEAQARKIFEGTEIHTKEKAFFNAHFRKYPVVYINFRPLLATTDRDSFRRHICQIVSDIRNNTDPTLFNLTAEEKIAEAKNFSYDCVSEFRFDRVTIDYTAAVYLHYLQRIIILIDEIDALTRAILKYNIVEQDGAVLDFRVILEKWVEGNEHIEKSFSVGSVSTDRLAHVDPYPACIERVAFNDNEKYAKNFGLTEREVENLLEKFDLAECLPRFTSYYDGYAVTNSSIHVYNTISSLEFVKKRKFAPYWAEYIEPLKDDFLGLISRPGIGSLVEKAIFRDMNDLPKFARLNNTIGNDIFHAIRGNVTECEKDVVAAGDIFLNFLKESGYVRMVTEDGFLATNQDAAYALGTTLARDSNYYQNSRNISSAAKMKLVKAVKNLALSEETMIELAAAIHGLFHPACPLVTKERVSFVGPIFTILAYEDPEAFEAVLTPLHVGVQPNKPDLVLVRKNAVAFVVTLKWGESAREFSEAAMASDYEGVFEHDWKGLKIESTIFVGINLDALCQVSISYGKKGMTRDEFKQVRNV